MFVSLGFHIIRVSIAMLCFVASNFTVNDILLIIIILSNLNKRSCNNHYFSAKLKLTLLCLKYERVKIIIPPDCIGTTYIRMK